MVLFAHLQTHSCHSCIEHALHLAAGHLLSNVTPIHIGETHGACNDDKGDELLGDDASSDDSVITPGALRKLMGLIKQVHPIDHNYDIY